MQAPASQSATTAVRPFVVVVDVSDPDMYMRYAVPSEPRNSKHPPVFAVTECKYMVVVAVPDAENSAAGVSVATPNLLHVITLPVVDANPPTIRFWVRDAPVVEE